MTAQIWMLTGIVLLLFGAAVLVVMQQQARKLTVREEDFTKEGETPIRFVLLSDIHISKMPIRWEYVCDRIARATPDFVAVAGDLIFSKKDGPAALSFFECLLGYVSCPIYIVYGNHDLGKLFETDPGLKNAFTREMHSLSPLVHVIEDRNIIYTKDGRSVVLCGLTDFRTMEAAAVRAQWEEARALAGKMDASLLLISHNPDILTEFPDACADLAVFGHYHDGQVHLPGRIEFSLLRPADQLASEGYIYGRYTYKGTPVYITSGIGNTNLAIRYKSTPEVVVICF